LPLPQVNLRQFDPTVSGNVDRPAGGGVGVRVSLVRSGPDGQPLVVARASTTTAADGSWSVSLGSHAPGDDRDEIDVDYSGAGAPQPNHQVILTGNGGSPYTESGWTGWFDLDEGSAATRSSGASSLTLSPCFQAGVLSVTFDGTANPESATDFCNTQTDAASLSTALIAPADRLAMSSNDNRAFDSPDSPTPNPQGGLVSLSVPVGEANSVSQYENPLGVVFTPGGLPTCTADLELQAVACFGLVSGGAYDLIDGKQKVSGTADSTGTFVEPLFIKRGDAVALSNGSRTLTTLHVAHLQVAILGEETSIFNGHCQPGDYFGSPLTTPPVSVSAGLPTSLFTGGTALTGQACPANGDASGLPTSFIAQTDDLSGGQTETEVPDIEDTSPMEGETMYGKFTALAESGLSIPGNMIIPTDFVTQISLRIATAAKDQTAFLARDVDTTRGVAVPALKPGSYTATWALIDSNGDTRIVQTRFIEQAGRVGRGPRMHAACGFVSAVHTRIRCRVSFPGGGLINGTVRLRLTRGGVVVGLGHARVRRGRATVTMKVLRHVSSGAWLATVVLDRPHVIAVTSRADVKSVN
jgi:hypothetical protein